MNPPCAGCKKTVYPVEKLNCLDKVWHKACFKCQECGLRLTMKTYKGYNKTPYCNTHYPTTRFTAVADTPENLRLKQQSKQQSQLEYQKDYRTSLKEFHQVSDSVAQQQMTRAAGLASESGYRTAPQDMESVGQGYQHQPPPQSYNQPPPMSYTQPPAPQPSYNPPPSQPSYPPSQPSYPPSQPSYPTSQKAPAPPPGGPRYLALYDYTAADDDEVSFKEGDYIVDAEIIDEGWMEGRVERTGQRGMLPSNYVEKV